MSAVTEQRPSISRGEWAERLLAWRPTLTPEVAAYAAILTAAFALRFWDLGARAMHHDESLHATYSWYLFKGRGYEHHPLMHGPFLFHAMALSYLLFGVSEATSRIVPAAFGTMMVPLPLLLRPWLGRVGALTAAALLAISPTMLYFSRFVGAGAQDIVVAVGMLLLVVGIWHTLRSGEAQWLYLTAAGLALCFTTKEVAYILTAILVLYLSGQTGVELAAQTPAQAELRPAARRLFAVPFMLLAWFLVLFWPFISGLREKLGLKQLPRGGELLLVVGTLSAPMFSAGVQVVLERLGVDMARMSPISGWTNEKFWGAITIGGLMALAVYFGTAWDARRWLTAAAIFWGACITLATTFFTNPEGVATFIWGSLDYWLQQQHVLRGNQPVFYYLVITPVYEYLPLALALAGVAYTAIRTGWDTTLAAVLAVLLALAGAWLGDGAHATLPFVVPALLAATYAVRARPFQQFCAFWLGAMLIGLSSAGEKMPWLEVHLALPLILLAALALDEAARVAVHTRRPAWRRPVVAMAATGVVGALLAVFSDDHSWANPALAALLLGGVGALVIWTVRRRAVAGLAGAALVIGLAGPLTLRTAKIAAYDHGDIPKELLVYTQTSPELVAVKKQIEQLARQTGLGHDLPIVVDSTEAFTWPWAWYLRDYRRVSYPDLSAYRNNPALLNTLPPGGVLLAEITNADIGLAVPGLYGPGHRYQHRAWFPEEDYRILTTRNLWRWVRRPESWRDWGRFFLHRTTRSRSGSIDAVAYFPPEWDLRGLTSAAARPAPEPRQEADGRIVAGAYGAGPGQFQRPAGVAVDREGNIYVADSLNHRIQKFAPDGRHLAILGGPRVFREPWGVAVAPDGTIYVADTWNHRIQKFGRDFKLLASWGAPPARTGPGAPPPSPLELYGPRAIAIDGQGHLWVTDTGHSRLVKYSPDGQPLGTFGTNGTGPGQFQEPVGVAIAPNGDVLVTDTWNGRVQRFDASFTYKGEFEVDGWSDRGSENKPYIAVAADGSVWVTVPESGRALRYGADGRLLDARPVTGIGAPAGRPLGIAVAADGGVWVTDGVGATIVYLPSR